MVTGAGGMLGRAVTAELERRGCTVAAFDRAALDVTDAEAVAAITRGASPEAVVHCAAWTAVDAAEEDEAGAARVNADGTAHMARACAEAGARLVYPSTDYVFDGTASSPIPPDAATAPLNAYGRSKLAGEAMAAAFADALIVRTSWLYGRGGRNFVSTVLRRARDGQPLRVVNDQRGSPTWTRDAAAMMVGLLDAGAPAGVYHATNRGETTWYGLACAALELAGVDADVQPVTSAEFPAPARRPAYSVLDCTAAYAIVGPAPHWRDALTAAVAGGLE